VVALRCLVKVMLFSDPFGWVIRSLVDYVNGLIFPLPASGQPDINLLQEDGTFLTIGYGKVVISGETIAIDMNGDTPKTVTAKSGTTVYAAPGSASPPPPGFSVDPIGSAFGLFKGLTKTCGVAASGLQQISKQVTSWTEGGSDDLLSGLDDIFRDTMNGLDKIVKDFRATQKIQSFELTDLTDEGRQVVEELQPRVITTLDLMRSLDSFRHTLGNLPVGVRPVTSQQFKYFLGIAGLSTASLITYLQLNWDHAVKVSQTSKTTTATTSTTSSTTSSSTPSSTAQAKAHCIMSYEGTPTQKFDAWASSFDGKKGRLTLDGPWLLYTTDLNATQVKDVQSLDFVQFVVPTYTNWAPALSRADVKYGPHQLYKRKLKETEARAGGKVKRSEFVRDALHFKILSTPPPPDGTSPAGRLARNYFADDTLGRGVVIIVIDTGFNLNVAVSFISPKCFVGLIDNARIFNQAEWRTE
jgi:hypothetical protein